MVLEHHRVLLAEGQEVRAGFDDRVLETEFRRGAQAEEIKPSTDERKGREALQFNELLQGLSHLPLYVYRLQRANRAIRSLFIGDRAPADPGLSHVHHVVVHCLGGTGHDLEGLVRAGC